MDSVLILTAGAAEYCPDGMRVFAAAALAEVSERRAIDYEVVDLFVEAGR